MALSGESLPDAQGHREDGIRQSTDYAGQLVYGSSQDYTGQVAVYGTNFPLPFILYHLCKVFV